MNANEELFKQICHLHGIKIERSHFVNGYGTKYITAKVGTVYFTSSDIRLGVRSEVMFNLTEGGAVSNLSGCLTPAKMTQFLITDFLSEFTIRNKQINNNK